MNSTRAQLLYDQLVADYQNDRVPSIHFLDAIEAWSTASANDKYRHPVAKYLWTHIDDKYMDRPIDVELATDIWFIAFLVIGSEATDILAPLFGHRYTPTELTEVYEAHDGNVILAMVALSAGVR